ncbi:MAG: hypothetical protein Q9M15_05430 [Mariprofundaceae bacterium]|nr:hypothetical protein [Mariprofundaceae bacterium]
MPNLLMVVMMLWMTSCKTVDVLVPATYPLLHSEELVVHDFKGPEGSSMSHYVLADLQRHLPQLVFYTTTMDGLHGSAVHLTGQVDVFHIGKVNIAWGKFNQEKHEQFGEVERHIDIQVLVQLKNQNQQVLWTHIFSKQEEQSEHFSFYSEKAYQSLDGESDLWKGKILSGISDLVKQDNMEDQAQSYFPSISRVRQKMLFEMSQTIAQSFYDRIEKHLEFR